LFIEDTDASGEVVTGGKIELEEASTILRLPYYADAEYIRIFNEQLELQITIPLNQGQLVEESAAKIQEKTGINFLLFFLFGLTFVLVFILIRRRKTMD
jgi:hypothetical protein